MKCKICINDYREEEILCYLLSIGILLMKKILENLGIINHNNVEILYYENTVILCLKKIYTVYIYKINANLDCHFNISKFFK